VSVIKQPKIMLKVWNVDPYDGKDVWVAEIDNNDGLEGTDLAYAATERVVRKRAADALRRLAKEVDGE
jgi:hypothetical protein